MSRSRVVPLALAVTLLLVVVGLVARGRPLGRSSGTGNGLPVSFWDYTYTTIVIVAVPIVFGVLVAAVLFRPERGERPSYRSRMLRSIVFFLLLVLIEFFVLRHLDLSRLHQQQATQPVQTTPIQPPRNGGPAKTSLHFRWDELAIILGVLLVLAAGVAIALRRSRLGRRTLSGTPDEIAPEALAAALDESLDDLRSDPDLRRAIIAAYARMETALAAAGIPRRPAQAPLEYLERALLSLDTSAGAVRRLTDLFEWARFSHHEPEASMRDEAVDALVAVRDELRASELTPA